MTDPIHFERDTAPGLLDDLSTVERDRGWWIAESDGVCVVQFLDGSPSIIGDQEALRFLVATNPNITPTQKEGAMPSQEANYIDEAVAESTGILSKYLDPALKFIGQHATSAAEVMRTKRPWNDLARSEVLGRVTLDVEPETPGRPQPGRPGTTQVVFMCLPEWHPAFRAGVQEVAALIYEPSTTYLAERIEGGAVVKEPRASSYDVTGWVGIVDYFGDLQSAEEERTALWDAVKASSRSELLSEEVDSGTVDPGNGRYGSADAWGL